MPHLITQNCLYKGKSSHKFECERIGRKKEMRENCVDDTLAEKTLCYIPPLTN